MLKWCIANMLFIFKILKNFGELASPWTYNMFLEQRCTIKNAQMVSNIWFDYEDSTFTPPHSQTIAQGVYLVQSAGSQVHPMK